jgi:hypothetical protein
MSRWSLAEETVDERTFRYLIGGRPSTGSCSPSACSTTRRRNLEAERQASVRHPPLEMEGEFRS